MVTAASIGVLAFQGDVERHLGLLAGMNRSAVAVRTPEDLDGVAALIIPGGESTTIGMLSERFGLLGEIRRRVAGGMPVLGTCAGAILLARDIEGSDQPRVGVMDIEVRRNAYGRQIESFEADLELSRGAAPAEPARSIRAVFIRAPIITRVGKAVEVLARFEDDPVVIRQANMLAATFHPELTGETAVHQILLEAMDASSEAPAPGSV